MQKKRFIRHLQFWLAYYACFTLIESSYDYHNYKAYMLANLIKLPLKMGCTYFILYFILPRFFHVRRYLALSLYLTVIVIVAGVLFRVLHGYILLPLSYPGLAFTPWDIGRFLWGIFEVFFPAVIAVSLKLFLSRFENLRREQELRSEKMQAELSFLRSQLNPHFLFNTMNNIYGLSLVNAPETSESILRLSDLLRFVLNNSVQHTTRISDEIAVIEDYIALERLRYDERLHLSFEKELDDPGQSIAPLLLLPLVENSFKHGVSEAMADAYVHIKLRLRNKALYVEICNKDTGKAPNENGIGLKNVKRQLELIYPDRHRFEHESTGVEFRLLLTINLGEHENA